MISRIELRNLFKELDKKFNSPKVSETKDCYIDTYIIVDDKSGNNEKKFKLL